MDTSNFSSFPLHPEILQVIEELGFSSPTPIQSESILPLLNGEDFIGQSRTGSGKTAAYGWPILQKVELENHMVQAIVICPTRELSAQVAKEIRKLGRRLPGLNVLVAVGGESSREQRQSLAHGVHIVVGTPGRILDLMEKGSLELDLLRMLVLDEADKMLSMGFELEMKAIMDNMPPHRQTILFSATFPEGIQSLSRKYQKKPKRVVIDEGEAEKIQIKELVYEFDRDDKSDILMRVLQQHPAQSTLIFCNQKLTVDAITQKINELGVSCGALHGDFEQRERDRVMTLFRNGSCRILVATDVAARGLDIEDLELVINYDLPQDSETYIHRIGRTGRAGKEGLAITLAKPIDAMRIFELEKVVSRKFEKPKLGFKNQHGLSSALKESAMQTLSISGGRKDKLRPGDILGALTGEGSHLQGSQIGKIDVQEKITYVGISASQADAALDHLRKVRIKGQKFQIRLVKT